jgi:hypothetical protein
MKVRKHFTIGLALTGLALGLSTFKANAQQGLNGTFELPEATYWGSTLLQPGRYTISMTTEAHAISRVPIIHLSGDGVNAAFLSIATPAHESGRNYLNVANIGGTYVIRAFDSGMLGESFSFGVTKSVKNKALRASTEPAMAFPFSMAAGS